MRRSEWCCRELSNMFDGIGESTFSRAVARRRSALATARRCASSHDEQPTYSRPFRDDHTAPPTFRRQLCLKAELRWPSPVLIGARTLSLPLPVLRPCTRRATLGFKRFGGAAGLSFLFLVIGHPPEQHSCSLAVAQDLSSGNENRIILRCMHIYACCR